MNLSDYEFFPGSIINVDDPKYLGRVKAIVPTVFDTSMNEDGLPWIYPFTMSGYQRFSKMQKGSKIWVLKNKTNYTEFWYIPMFEMTEESRKLMGGDDENYSDSEVLLNRTMGNMSVKVYFNTKDGVKIQYGDNNHITINPDGEAIIQAGTGMVKISGNHVYVGDGDNGEPAVMGDQLKTLLNNLSSNLAQCSSAAMSLYMPCPALVTALQTASSGITADSVNLLAKNTNVD